MRAIIRRKKKVKHNLTRGMPGDVDLFLEMHICCSWKINKWCISSCYEMLRPIYDNRKQESYKYKQLNYVPFHVFNSTYYLIFVKSCKSIFGFLPLSKHLLNSLFQRWSSNQLDQVPTWLDHWFTATQHASAKVTHVPKLQQCVGRIGLHQVFVRDVGNAPFPRSLWKAVCGSVCRTLPLQPMFWKGVEFFISQN